MKIIYFANFQNKNSDNTEQHIQKAFEDLGHKVIPIQEENIDEILKVKNPDLFLFHKAGIGRTITEQQLVKMLCNITCKKACWFFDKITPQREEFIRVVSEYSDYVFVTDDTWRRRHKYENMFCLRQGIGKKYPSFKLEEYECDVAFVGSIYSQERADFVSTLSRYYGDKFKVFSDVFNADLNCLCNSAKVIIAPPFLADDFYWSSRIYMILGSGGFLVHPDLYGLKDEFDEGKHFAGYRKMDEIFPTIDYFLDNPEERESIKQQGYKRCWEVANYNIRVKQLCQKYGK